MAVCGPITTARFWSKADVRRSSAECWEWKAAFGSNGYGSFKLGARTIEAHRLAFSLANGGTVPPKGVIVRHTCDNPKCVNPQHLVAGTKLQNSQDMMDRGRWRGVEQAGENNGAAKLTADQVAQIRVRISARETNMGIAADYGVSHATISAIKCGRSWRENESSAKIVK
jgi:hypothetical protein